MISRVLLADGFFRRHQRRAPRMASLVGLVALVACGGSEERPELPAWVVDPEPVTSIGMVEGDSVFLFQQVVATGLLSDGRIMVADGGLSVLRVFDPSGGFLVQMGRSGEGPGEFAQLRDARVTAGDTIVVWDSRGRRLSRFTPDGDLVGTVSVQPPPNEGEGGGLDGLAGVFPDGSVVLTRLALGERSAGQGIPDRLTLERYGPEGEFLGQSRERTGLVRVVTSVGSGPLPFTPFPYFVTADERLYATDGLPPVVSVLDTSLVDLGRIDFPAASHDVAGAWSALAARLDEPGAPPMSAWLDELMTETTRPDSMPHIAGLVADDRSRLWTKQYDPATDALWLRSDNRVRGGVWWVGDASTGTLVARASIPERLAPVEVQGDRLLGVSVDELGVQRVQLHEIQRPRGEGER